MFLYLFIYFIFYVFFSFIKGCLPSWDGKVWAPLSILISYQKVLANRRSTVHPSMYSTAFRLFCVRGLQLVAPEPHVALEKFYVCE